MRPALRRFCMIILKNLTLRRSAKVLLDNASATINPGERVGLVGRNGAGKSSLFALLNGTLHEDKGDFSVPAQWRLAQVAQDMPETGEPATRFVIAGDTVLAAAQAEVAAAEESNDGAVVKADEFDLSPIDATFGIDLVDIRRGSLAQVAVR
jgi:ATP-binding cassette subfamily F protein 3